MNERLGIMENQQRLRESATRNLTPAARHQAFPALFAKPSPDAPPTAAVAAQLAGMTLQLAARTKELAEIEAQIAAKKRELRDLGARVAFKLAPEIIHIQEAFCGLLRDAGYLIEGRLYTFNDLVCRSNHTPHVEPRHVCIDLARRITTPTLVSIAKAFGYRDHTSVKHALQQAPGFLAGNPMLAEVHAKVLALFQAQQ